MLHDLKDSGVDGRGVVSAGAGTRPLRSCDFRFIGWGSGKSDRCRRLGQRGWLGWRALSGEEDFEVSSHGLVDLMVREDALPAGLAETVAKGGIVG